MPRRGCLSAGDSNAGRCIQMLRISSLRIYWLSCVLLGEGGRAVENNIGILALQGL